MGNLVPLLLILALTLIWLDGARAREFAIELARSYCRKRGLQFLDETVALARMGLRWTREGLRVRRMFRFDFSLEGSGRHVGYVLMLGTRLERIDDGLEWPEEAPSGEAAGPEADSAPITRSTDGKVVPFRRPGPGD